MSIMRRTIRRCCRRFIPFLAVLLMVSGMLSGCAAGGTQTVELEMTLPDQQEISTGSEVNDIDVYQYTIRIAEADEKLREALKDIWSEIVKSPEYYDMLVQMLRSYGLAQAGFADGKIWLQSAGEDGVSFRYIDPSSGFYEEAFKNIKKAGRLEHVWTAPDGSARIREEKTGWGAGKLFFETPDGKAEELKLTDRAIPEGSLWQCAWSADSSTACLRLCFLTGMGGNWDELAVTAVTDLFAEYNDSETSEDGQTVTDGDAVTISEDMSEEKDRQYFRELWKVVRTENGPEVRAVPEGDFRDGPNLFAGQDGQNILTYYDYYNASDMDAHLIARYRGDHEILYYNADRNLRELDQRACLNGDVLIWAYENQLIRTELVGEDAVSGVYVEVPEAEYITQIVAEHNPEKDMTGVLAMCGPDLYRLGPGTKELLYRGRPDQLAVGLALQEENGEILINYLDKRTAGFDEPEFELVCLRY